MESPSFGAALIGFGAASFLCGCMLVQVYIYSTSDSARVDSYRFKFLITAIWFIDMAQMIVLGDYVYSALIVHYDDPSFLGRGPWSFALVTALNVCVSTPVQMFYAWRVYILAHKNLVLPFCISIMSLLSFSCGIATGVLAGTIGEFAKYHRVIFIVDTWLGADIVTDFLIVSSLYYFLTRGRTGYSQTDKVIDKLVFLLINSGLAPTLMELAHLLAFTIAPNSFAHLSFNFIVPKLYANSFMATLNARTYLLGTPHKGSMSCTRTRDQDRYEMPSFAPPRPSNRPTEGSDVLDIKITAGHDHERRLNELSDCRETGSVHSKSYNGSTYGSITV